MYYTGAKTKEISFPLGGIGTGCIGISGNGRLIDWEIFNRPHKGSINGYSHFAIKAESEGEVLDVRVLNGDFPYPYTGSTTQNIGFGVARTTLAGLPHFQNIAFQGEYPFGEITFEDECFPGLVKLTAFNPLIPLNDKDSSIPGAFFEIEVSNETDQDIDYTICLSVTNPLSKGSTCNRYVRTEGMSLLQLTSTKYHDHEIGYGDLTVATDGIDVSYQEYWYRGAWFDNVTTFWSDFTTPGKFTNRTYNNLQEGFEILQEHHRPQDTGTLAVHLFVTPRSQGWVRFILTWNFPNCENYWNPEKCNCASDCLRTNRPKTWRNYYATLFKNSMDSALYSLKNWSRLRKDTLAFKEALFSSTLPAEVLDAVSANISILKTPTALRLEDGSFYGWEGCGVDSGCCEGSCTHVWNYAYALPFLFPKLERTIRELDYRYNMREDGRMSFRLQLPLGRERMDSRACADGQFGGVIKVYREWKISGDTEWLREIWDKLEKSIDFAWAESNEDQWDADRDGILEGRQHHTLDMELFGPNSWLTGIYLAALKAGAEMASHLGYQEKAKEYLDIFEKGKAWVDEHLFNGEYYQQQIDLKDKSIIDRFSAGCSLLGISTEQAYWNSEKQEIKYQIGDGCIIDQVLAQWHANLCGLGEIFDRNKVNSALKAIYKHNFKRSFRNFFNPCRLYSLNDEAGMIICEWPEGKYKPVIPIPYAEETMNGFEYQAAIHMIQEGLVEEGLEIVKVVRERYDGEKRNPWNEFECGSNYARSMASYALLNAFSGFTFDMITKHIGFNPVQNPKTFRCFWSLDCAWGMYEHKEREVRLSAEMGELVLNTFSSGVLSDKQIKGVFIGDRTVQYTIKGSKICFTEPVRIIMDSSLHVVYE